MPFTFSKSLTPFEQLCRKQYTSLHQAGYQLRPRYDPIRTESELEPPESKHQNELSVVHAGLQADNTIDAIFNNTPLVLRFIQDLTATADHDQPRLIEYETTTGASQVYINLNIRYYSDELYINRFLGGISTPTSCQWPTVTDRTTTETVKSLAVSEHDPKTIGGTDRRHGDHGDHGCTSDSDLQKYNHCLPVLNELTLADLEHIHPRHSMTSLYGADTVTLSKVLVHPLFRPWCSPGFETIGEVVDFLWQAFVGLQFIHKHGVALRKSTLLTDVVMDANEMFPEGYHFITRLLDPTWKRLAKCLGPRSEYPPKYYWRLSQPIHDPSLLPQDVYNLGSHISWVFMDDSRDPTLVMTGLAFLKPLITSMTHQSPTARPTMTQAVASLRDIIVNLPESKLRELVPSDDVFKYKPLSSSSARAAASDNTDSQSQRSWRWGRRWLLSNFKNRKMVPVIQAPAFPKRKDVVGPWDYEDYDLEGSDVELQQRFAAEKKSESGGFESVKVGLYYCR